MKQELYLNDKLADLSPDTQITLNFNSNILSDITKIVQSTSQTVKLPKTLNNKKITDCADIVSYNGTFLRTYNKARYLRNGLEIFKGKAVLLASEDTFEIVLTWSELTELITMLQSSDKLPAELQNMPNQTPPMVEWRPTQQNITNINGMQGHGFVMYQPGTIIGDLTKYLFNVHPFVGFWEILQKIQQKYNLVFDFEQWHADFLKNLAFICVSRNEVKDNTVFSFSNRSINYQGAIYSVFGDILNSNHLIGVIFKDNYLPIKYDRIYIKVVPDYRFRFYFTKLPAGLKLMLFDSNGNLKISFILQSGNTFYVPVHLDDIQGKYDIKEGDYFAYISDDTNFSCEITAEYSNIEILNNLDFDELTYPSLFSIYANLPDISIAEFIKSVCWLTGTYCTRNNNNPNNEILFRSVDTLYENKSNAYDWSEKLLTSVDKIKIEYRYQDYSQRNNMLYKDDETVRRRDANSFIAVKDSTLPTQQDIITLPFAATDNYIVLSTPPTEVITASISQYIEEYDESGMPLTIFPFTEVKPRIVRFDSKYKVATFEGLRWSNLISQFYTKFQQMILQPIVITVNLRLNELDLKNLDFQKPVYFRQFGRYYGIITIQNTDRISKAQLVQLN